MLGGRVAPGGDLAVNVTRVRKADWRWTLRNMLRWAFWWGVLTCWLARAFSRVTGIPTIIAELRVRVRKVDGTWMDYGVVSRRVVTSAGVAAIVDDWDDGSASIADFNYHGCGTGTTSEDASDTDLESESTTVLQTDSTRATGTKSQPSANQIRSVGTVTFDGSAAITEHGLFSHATVGQGVLWDRSVFSALNMSSGESIQFTYTATFPSGS